MNIINNNPYRILGILSQEFSLKENTSKLNGQKPSSNSPLYLNGILRTEIHPTKEEILQADTALQDPTERVLAAMFWLSGCEVVSDTSSSQSISNDILSSQLMVGKGNAYFESNPDLNALELIVNGKLEEAVQLLSKVEDPTIATFQNMTFCLLLLGRTREAAENESELINHHRRALLQSLGLNASEFSRDKLLRIFLKELTAEIGELEILKLLGDSPLTEKVASGQISLYYKYLSVLSRDYVAQATSIHDALELLNLSTGPLAEIKSLSRYLKNGKKESQRVATRLAMKCLSIMITNVNMAIKSDTLISQEYLASLEKVPELFRKINQLDLYPDFRAIGLESIRKKFVNILEKNDIKFDGLESISDGLGNPAITNYGIDTLDLRDSEEFYKDSPKDALTYCQRYPYGSQYKKMSALCDRDFYNSEVGKNHYRRYLCFFPNGQFAKEARQWYHELWLKELPGSSLATCLYFMEKFPDSDAMEEVRRIAEDFRAKDPQEAELRARQTRKAAEFDLLDDLIIYCKQNPIQTEDTEIWVQRAIELCLDGDDYNKMLDQYQWERPRKKNRLTNFENKWSAATTIVALIFVLMLIIAVVTGYTKHFQACLFWLKAAGVALAADIAILIYRLQNRIDSNVNPIAAGVVALAFGYIITSSCWFIVDRGYQKARRYVEEQREAVYYEAKLPEGLTFEECKQYLKKFPHGKMREKVLQFWYDKAFTEMPRSLTDKGNLNAMQELATLYPKTPQGRAAADNSERLVRNLYYEASEINNIDTWKTYRKRVPEQYYYDSQEMIDSIVNIPWATDDRAWATALVDGSSRGYRKYLESYPEGNHAFEAENRLIDYELKVIHNSVTSPLPPMHKVADGEGDTSLITVYNKQAVPITVFMVGRNRCLMEIPPAETGSILVPNGYYYIGVMVNTLNVKRLSGGENFTGGTYHGDF